VRKCPVLFKDSLLSVGSEDSFYSYVRLNGLALKNLITMEDSVVVYIWAPRCHSKYCPSLNYVINKYRNTNTKVFIVAEYYDCVIANMKRSSDFNIIGIDTDYYKANRTEKYLRNFLFDLTGEDDLQTGVKRLLKFHKGVFVQKFTLE
jgi:hypothetical protein